MNNRSTVVNSGRAWRRIALLPTLVVAGLALAAGPASASAHPSAWGRAKLRAIAPPVHASSLDIAPLEGSLSDERTLTRWANADDDAPVYADPTTASRRVSRLRFETEDGFDEVYLLLASHVDASGQDWIQVRLPARPNGQTGWVKREALGDFNVVRTLLQVDRRRLRATLYSIGRRVWSAPVGVGKRSTPTPAGHFWVREAFSVSGAPAYGPFAFGTSAYSDRLTDWPGGGVIGIHGTDEPRLVPGRPSHGCMRMHNGDIRWLARHMPVGTPIRIV